MKIKRPSFQFYPGDWANDNNLKLCSLAAQGLWIKILCVLHDSEVYGRFCYSKIEANDIANGVANIKQGSNFCYQLARLTGESENVIAPLLNELVNSKVAKIDDDGFMYSKRMMHDERIRRIRQEAGSQGGKKHWRGKNSEETGDLFAIAKPIANLKQTVEDEDEDKYINGSNTDNNAFSITKGGVGEKFTIEERIQQFGQKVSEFRTMYDDAMLFEFFEYWTEHNAGAKKARFEKQEIFDISKRLAYWKRNKENFKQNGHSKKHTSEELAAAAKRMWG